MHLWTSIFAALGALLVGAMSPGPSFIVVARTAIGLSRPAGLATALGMGLGGMLFALVALAGLYSLFAAVPWLYLAIKIAGGLYLLYLAWMLWSGASQPLAVETRGEPGTRTVRRAFWIGLSTQLSNPKTALFYGSVFAALLPEQAPLWASLVLMAAVFVVEAGWYSFVALAFSSRRPREYYLSIKGLFDRVAAVALGALGLRLLWTSNKAGL